jgi:ribonuclease HI
MVAIAVYTDGSCSKNGRLGAVGGIGVYFGENDERNHSESLGVFYKLEFGRSTTDTNNLAELCAILKACKILENELGIGNKIIIKTDSNYSINCLTKWNKVWIANNWMNAKNKPVSNKEVIKKILDEYLLKYDKLVSFKHVKAHTNLKNEDSIGNARADALARKFVF